MSQFYDKAIQQHSGAARDNSTAILICAHCMQMRRASFHLLSRPDARSPIILARICLALFAIPTVL